MATEQRPRRSGLWHLGLALLLGGLLETPGVTQPREGLLGNARARQARDTAALQGPETRMQQQDMALSTPGAPRQAPPVQPMPTPSQGDTPKGRDGLATPERAVTPMEPVWGEAQRRLPPGYEDKLQQLCRILSVSSIAGIPCA